MDEEGEGKWMRMKWKEREGVVVGMVGCGCGLILVERGDENLGRGVVRDREFQGDWWVGRMGVGSGIVCVDG